MQLEYKNYGETGPPVIILHGLLGSSKNWHTAARKLAEECRVTVPSLRNHGGSPHGRHGLDEMVGDVLHWLDQQDVSRVFLLGHSMGGMVAMALACRYPERLQGLVVVDISPVNHLNPMLPTFAALESVSLERIKRREDADNQLAQAISSPFVRQFLLQNLKRTEEGTYVWQCNLPELSRFVREEKQFFLQPSDRFTGATLFIGGGRSEHRLEDQHTAIQRHFPQSTLVMIPEAGHWVHFEALQPFLDATFAFIHKVQSAPGEP